MPESSRPPPSKFILKNATPRRLLTPEEIAAFHNDGFVVLRDFLSAEEVELLSQCMANDPLVMGTPADGSMGRNISVADANGRETKLTLWWNFGEVMNGSET